MRQRFSERMSLSLTHSWSNLKCRSATIEWLLKLDRHCCCSFALKTPGYEGSYLLRRLQSHQASYYVHLASSCNMPSPASQPVFCSIHHVTPNHQHWDVEPQVPYHAQPGPWLATCAVDYMQTPMFQATFDAMYQPDHDAAQQFSPGSLSTQHTGVTQQQISDRFDHSKLPPPPPSPHQDSCFSAYVYHSSDSTTVSDNSQHTLDPLGCNCSMTAPAELQPSHVFRNSGSHSTSLNAQSIQPLSSELRQDAKVSRSSWHQASHFQKAGRTAGRKGQYTGSDCSSQQWAYNQQAQRTIYVTDISSKVRS